LNVFQLYGEIHKVLGIAKERVKTTSKWVALHEQHDIGRLSACGRWLNLSSADRMTLKKLAIKEVGADPSKISLEELATRSRTEAASVTNDEKSISRNPRSSHVEVRGINGAVGDHSHSDRGYLGMEVDEVLEMRPEGLLTVENFDTFASLKKIDLPSLITDDTLIVFRGDNKANPAAVKRLLCRHTGLHFHFGDFDSAGIRIGLQMGRNTSLILPDIGNIETLRKLSKSNSFADQESILKGLEANVIPSSFAPYVESIRLHNLAVTQESLIANGIPLKLIKKKSDEPKEYLNDSSCSASI